jgi:hypothetical protein
MLMEVKFLQARLDSEFIKDGYSNVLKSKFNGECICPICGFKIIHEKGVQCYNKSCPRCGMILTKTK